MKDDGIFQNEQEVFTHAYQGAGIKPGDVKFKDINNDGVIDPNDRVYAGSPIPKITYGLTGTVNFREWDLTLFFQGAEGQQDLQPDKYGYRRDFTGRFNITKRIATESWSGPGSSNEFPRLSWTGAQNNKQASTRFLENGSYTRLKNVQLGYNLSTAALRSLKISSMRFFVSAQNLFTRHQIHRSGPGDDHPARMLRGMG